MMEERARGAAWGPWLITAELVLAAGVIVWSATFSGEPLRGLLWLKSYKTLWYLVFVAHFIGLWVAGGSALVIGVRTLAQRDDTMARAFSGKSGRVAWIAVGALALLWPFLAIEHLKDDAVIKHFGAERAIICAAGLHYQAGRGHLASQQLEEFNRYYHEDLKGVVSHRTTIDRRDIEAARQAAQLKSRLTPEKRWEMLDKLPPDVQRWLLVCDSNR